MSNIKLKMRDESQYFEVDLTEADRTVKTSWSPRPFSAAILQMTPIAGLLRRVGQPVLFDFHRARILATLDRLPEAAREPSPKFVFAHLMYAHTPFVLDADGHSITPGGHYTWWPTLSADGGEFRKAYREQVAYLNTKLQEMTRRIVAESPRPPVIILQGDHGPQLGAGGGGLSKIDVRSRYSIFNAYLFPRGGAEQLYDSISPVNSFRVLFNHYFGTSYPLLEDRSYYTNFWEIYDFEPVSEELFQER